MKEISGLSMYYIAALTVSIEPCVNSVRCMIPLWNPRKGVLAAFL